jgi:hypothetical protein
MKRWLVVCLAMSAVAFTSALAVSSAAAIGPRDLACKQDTSCGITGEQTEGAKNEFKVNGGVVKCTGAKFKGDMTKGTTVTTESGGGADWAIHTVVVHPEYTGCTGFGQNVTVVTTGCNYELTANTNGATKEPGPYVEGTVVVTCETGKNIVITGNTTKCTVTVAAQTPTNNIIDFYNEGTKAGETPDVKVRATVGTEPLEAKNTGIKYTSSGGACGASGENGVYRGDVTAKCYSDDEKHTTQVACTLVDTVEEKESKKIQALP